MNVRIWLRPATEATNVALGFISEVLYDPKLSKILDELKYSSALDRSELDSLRDEHGAKWDALQDLMGNRWLSRRWTVQEMAFARDAIVECGEMQIPWKDFSKAARLLKHDVALVLDLPYILQLSLHEATSPWATRIVEVLDYAVKKRHDGTIGRRLKTLEDLLTSLPMYKQQMPHDAVYALLALGKDTWSGEKIQVNYSVSASKLFSQVVELAVQSSGSLDMICRPWAPLVENMPSWVCPASRYPLERLEDPTARYGKRVNADILVGAPRHTIYHASGRFTARQEFTKFSLDQSYCLIARGLCVSAVGEISDLIAVGYIPATAFTFAGWSEKGGAVPSPLLRTLIANRDSTGSPPEPWYRRVCEEVFEQAGDGDIDIRNLMTDCAETEPAKQAEEFLTRVYRCTFNRRLFKTSESFNSTSESAGNLSRTTHPALGCGPADLETSDLVYVLLGCSTPVILRKIDNAYRLIGECYLDGYMEGEALEGISSDEDPGLEDISIY